MSAARVAGDFVHGVTCNGYTNRGCRCDECKEAWRLWGLKRRAERREELASNPSVAHGSSSTYLNWGCRCDECRAAHTQSNRAYLQRATADPP